MVYVIPMYTFQCLIVKSVLLRTHKSTRYRYEKAMLYPLGQSNGSKICIWPGEAWSLERMSQSFCMRPGPSFIAKCNCGMGEKSFANFWQHVVSKGEGF